MTPAPIKPPIAFEDFEKLDIRVGTIASVNNKPQTTYHAPLATCHFPPAAAADERRPNRALTRFPQKGGTPWQIKP